MLYYTVLQRSHLDIISTTPAVDRGLGVDRTQILANNADTATLHYASLAPGPHSWLVNEELQSPVVEQDAATGFYCSQIAIKTAHAGPIVVTVGGESITVIAA